MWRLFTSRKIFLGHTLQFINGGIVVNEDGKIHKLLKSEEEVFNYKAENESIEEINFNDKVLMPGLIDTHVHVNDPGRTDWEGFETATKAAATGGFTTIVDMPLNSIPPTTTLENLETKLKEAEHKIFVDVAFWGGFVPTNIDELPKLVERGIKGFKCFLCPSGIDEFLNVNKDEVEEALIKLKGLDCVIAFHAELEPSSPIAVDEEYPEKYATYLNSRPPSMEISAIEIISELAQKYPDTKLHIVHLSTAEALPIIKECRQNGGQLTVETCHHYLNLCAEDIPDYHTEFKCSPPIREKTNQEKLWKAIQDKEINLIVSDHSPCTPDLKLSDADDGGEKKGNFLKAWGGIASNQFGLSLFWSNSKKYSLGLDEVYYFMCENPAKLCGLSNSKSKIEEGYDADFCVWDPEEEFTITKDIIQFKNKVTPYLNRTLQGVVYATVVRGQMVYTKPDGLSKPSGKLLI